MLDEFSVKLCTLVQMHPALYDICNDGFHDEESKTNAWQEIAGELGVAQSKCVIKWKSLKHQYVKAKKEENTTWDLWPYLQFLEETAAAKSNPKKRKRESMATPSKIQAPAPADVDMPSADSAGMEHVEIKTASRSSRSTRTSTVYKETVMTPTKGTFSGAESGTPLQPVATASTANPEKKEAKVGMARTARSRRASSVNNAVGDMDFTETGTPLQAVETASLVHFDENATTDPPPASQGDTHQANGTSSGTPLKEAAVHSRGTAKASSTPAIMQPEVVLTRIPMPSHRATHDKMPAVQPAASAQEATVSQAVNRKWTPRKMAATSAAPSKATAASPVPPKATAASPTPPKVTTASPAPPKVTTASPAPAKARLSSTPRGRRSMRVALAETILEVQEDDAQVEPPQPKRQKTEGNGVEANNPPDALADIKFEAALDQKFFKQLKEKLDKLRPEVASTMKASIFRMLDEAADN
nr:mucin-5AC-like [Rhipicephalus microplus]